MYYGVAVQATRANPLAACAGMKAAAAALTPPLPPFVYVCACVRDVQLRDSRGGNKDRGILLPAAGGDADCGDP